MHSSRDSKVTGPGSFHQPACCLQVHSPGGSSPSPMPPFSPPGVHSQHFPGKMGAGKHCPIRRAHHTGAGQEWEPGNLHPCFQKKNAHAAHTAPAIWDILWMFFSQEMPPLTGQGCTAQPRLTPPHPWQERPWAEGHLLGALVLLFPNGNRNNFSALTHRKGHSWQVWTFCKQVYTDTWGSQDKMKLNYVFGYRAAASAPTDPSPCS